MNPLEKAQPGQLFIRGDELWEVIGFNDQPTVCLQKISTTPFTSNRESVIARSDWAKEWEEVEPGRVIEILRDHIRRA